VWHWIKEDGEKSSQVRPLLNGKIWTLNKNDDNDDDTDSSLSTWSALTDLLWTYTSKFIILS